MSPFCVYDTLFTCICGGLLFACVDYYERRYVASGFFGNIGMK